MTTDTVTKQIAFEVEIAAAQLGRWNGLGVRHGSSMATMLAFITTDALISAGASGCAYRRRQVCSI